MRSTEAGRAPWPASTSSNADGHPGSVWHDGAPVAGAYVRLLDATGEFTAEVVTVREGEFRFFAAPGKWKVRSLARVGKGERCSPPTSA